MPTLFRMANGVYYHVLTEASGKRRWKSTGEQRKDRALAKIRQLDIQKEASGNSPSLDCFITELLAYVRSTLSPGSLEIYLKTINMFRRYMGNHRLPDSTQRHVSQYTLERLEEVSPVTVNVELRALRAAFSVALKWELITRNPFSKVQLMGVEDHLPHFFTKEELGRLPLFPDLA